MSMNIVYKTSYQVSVNKLRERDRRFQDWFARASEVIVILTSDGKLFANI